MKMRFKISSYFGNFRQSIVTGTIWITICTLASKILGFIRQMLAGWFFGTTSGFDAVIIALGPANFVAQIIASAFAFIAIPLYLERKAKNGEGSAKQFSRSLIAFTSLFLALFGVALFVYSNTLVRIFAPGFPKPTFLLASKYLKIFSILPLLAGMVQLFGAFLRAERMFFQYAFSSLIFNTVAIPTLWFLAPAMDVGAYATALVVGTAATALLLYLFGRRIWAAFPFSNPFTSQTFKAFYLASPLFLSMLLGNINSIVDKAFASMLPAGSVSALNYSFMIVNMITGVSSIGLITSSFTSISESAVATDNAALRKKIRNIIEFFLRSLNPVAAFIIVAAPQIIAIVYQRGMFTSASTAKTSVALIAYAPMILTVPLSSTLVNIYISQKHTLRVTLLGVPLVALNAVMDWWLMGPFKHAGIAASSSIVGLAWVIILALDVKSYYKLSNLFSRKAVLPLISSIVYMWVFKLPLANLHSTERLLLEITIAAAMVLLFTREELKIILGKITKK